MYSNACLSRTAHFHHNQQGAPYDPHSYLTSWSVPSHVEFTAAAKLEPPLTRDDLLAKIDAVQKELDPVVISDKWHEIHNDIHQQAIFLPLWGTRIPYVISRRLDNFIAPGQAFAYPLKTVSVVSGPKTVTVAPGSGGALFKSVGPMNPHQYFPNQLFVSGWIYEGLVSYGQSGDILPALATSWQVVSIPGGQRATFQLRQGVKFHDGSDWNCSVAKLNFDHVLSDIVRARHSWYGTPKNLKSWVCDANGDFVLETSTPFYPLLQELTYVRPLVFASANAFAQGLNSHPDLHNSCNPGDFGSRWAYLELNVTCAGLAGPYGTGPFKFANRTYLAGTNDTVDEMVYFDRHDQYWGGAPGIETLVIKHFEDTTAVYDALASGELDMVLGNGPLTSVQVRDIAFYNSSDFDVVRGPVLQNALLVMNTNRTPTDDITIRKAIIHGINKAEFIDSEFAGLEQPVSELLPLSAPYSDIDLNPKWSFDLEKAQLLACPAEMAADDNSLGGGAIAGIAVGVAVVVGLVIALFTMVSRERQGKPMFAPAPTAEST